MSNIILTPDLFAMIDQAGSIDSEIKALEKQLATLKTAIKAHGAGKHAGFVFSANVIDSERTTTDWATIAARFNPSHQLVSAHTTHAVIQSIRFAKV